MSFYGSARLPGHVVEGWPTVLGISRESSVSESTVLAISSCCLFIINDCAIALLINGC